MSSYLQYMFELNKYEKQVELIFYLFHLMLMSDLGTAWVNRQPGVILFGQLVCHLFRGSDEYLFEAVDSLSALLRTY